MSEAAVKNHFARVAVIAQEKYGVDLSRVMHRFDIRAGNLVGQAGWEFGWIRPGNGTKHRGIVYWCRWSPRCINANLQHYLEDVVPHEAAHIVAFMRPDLGARDHNPQWRQICIELGGNGSTRCHDENINESLARKRAEARADAAKHYLYRTKSGEEFKLSASRHAKIQRGTTYKSNASGDPIGRAQFVRISN